MKSNKSGHRSPIMLIQRLMPYLWGGTFSNGLPILLSLFFLVLSIAFNVSVPLIWREIIRRLDTCNVRPVIGIMHLLISYGVIWALGQCSMQFRLLALARSIERCITRLITNFFSHVLNLSLRFHVGRRTGALINAIERANKSIYHIVTGLFFYLVPNLIEIFLSVGILWYYFGAVYGMLLLMILFAYMLFSSIATEWSTRAQRINNEKESQASARFVDSLLNYETIKYFVNEQFEIKQIGKVLQEREDAATQKEVISELVYLGQSIVIGLGLLIMTIITGKAVSIGAMKLEDFVLINGYFLQFVTPLGYFGYILKQVRRSLSDLESLFDILAQVPEIKDAPHAQPLLVSKGDVVFDNVTFGYHPKRLILKGVSFTAPAGKTTAIVGASGAGKSTIARLLFRFYDVTSGRILIDGQDIKMVTQHSLRAAIGVVPQDTVLFNNTLAYNIAYGQPQATKEEIEQAVTMAHLDSFVGHLGDGLNTMVGERGLKLSGGEKQRVAIARVILKKAPIYIFDEATSALDTSTEREIQSNLEEISAGRTTLVIAHRLSTVVRAHQIIVLDHGVVVERGTHEELIAAAGVYAYLWQKQSQLQYT